MKKSEKEARKKQVQVEIKEIKLSPKTEKHDLEVKIRHILRFLEDKNKVKIRIIFKGRELAHPEMANRVLQPIFEAVRDKAKIEAGPKFEGRQMITILAPITKK